MLYLIGGENLYESISYLEELKSEFLKKNPGASIRTFNSDEIDNYKEILSDAESISLFSTQKLIIVKRLFSAKKDLTDKISDYVKSSKGLNFIFWEDKNLDKRRFLYKFIKKKSGVKEFLKLRESSLKTWMTKYISSKLDFEPECMGELLQKIGDDQLQLSSMIDNLITMVKADGRRKLLLSDLEKLVIKTAEESIWELMDAIGESNKGKALNIVELLLRESQDFVIIVAMIARQFRILSLVKYLISLGKSSPEITRKLRLHPFVVRKALAHSRNFTIKHLKKLYQKLVRTDLAVKEGRFDGKLALDLFIAAL